MMVYGGDLEIPTYCHLSGLSIGVYIDSIKQWAIYVFTTQLPKVFVFLMLKHCHFEVINVCLYTHKMSDRSVMNEEKQPKKDLNYDVTRNQSGNYKKIFFRT